MEMGIVRSKSFETYVAMCGEVTSVREKLGSENISQGKREKLAYRLKDLEGRIIPRQIYLINISDGARFGCEKISL